MVPFNPSAYLALQLYLELSLTRPPFESELSFQLIEKQEAPKLQPSKHVTYALKGCCRQTSVLWTFGLFRFLEVTAQIAGGISLLLSLGSGEVLCDARVLNFVRIPMMRVAVIEMAMETVCGSGVCDWISCGSRYKSIISSEHVMFGVRWK